MIMAHLSLGILILALVQQITLPSWLHPSLPLLILFLLLSAGEASVLKLKPELLEYWAPGKIVFLFYGLAAGIVLASIPVMAGLLGSTIHLSDLGLDPETGILSVTTTFMIVAWEELWFRGIYLNYCARKLSPVRISVAVGLLFMLIHALNPDINLAAAGPALFCAGALLTLLYFCYGSIWLPLGLHFGNNLMGSALVSGLENDPVYGADGYIGGFALALLFLFYLRRAMNKQKETSGDDFVDQ